MSRFTTAFLDRDGVMIERAADDDYVRRPDDVVMLPGAAAAVGRLNAAGIFVALVTNQRGVSRGLMTLDDVDAVNGRMAALLAVHGARVDAVYVCPHSEGVCDCRKPAPGLLLRAACEHDRVHLATAVMVGDSETDVEAGRAAGAATVRLAATLPNESRADVVLPDLAAAVDWILGPQWPAASQSVPTPTETSSGTDSS